MSKFKDIENIEEMDELYCLREEIGIIRNLFGREAIFLYLRAEKKWGNIDGIKLLECILNNRELFDKSSERIYSRQYTFEEIYKEIAASLLKSGKINEDYEFNGMKDEILKINDLPQEGNKQYLERARLIGELQGRQFAIRRLKSFFTKFRIESNLENQEVFNEIDLHKVQTDMEVSELQLRLAILNNQILQYKIKLNEAFKQYNVFTHEQIEEIINFISEEMYTSEFLNNIIRYYNNIRHNIRPNGRLTPIVNELGIISGTDFTTLIFVFNSLHACGELEKVALANPIQKDTQSKVRDK